MRRGDDRAADEWARMVEKAWARRGRRERRDPRTAVGGGKNSG